MAAAVEMGCTTVLMQGGLNPELPFDYYTDMVRATRARFPGLTPHFWSAPEVYEMAKVSGLSYDEVMAALFAAGQRTFPAAARRCSPTASATPSARSRWTLTSGLRSIAPRTTPACAAPPR